MSSVYEDGGDHSVGFLHLPTEIRLRIYEYLFSTNPSLVSIRSLKHYVKDACGCGHISTIQQIKHTIRIFGLQETRPFILLACKTTYAEAWSTFWQFAILHWGTVLNHKDSVPEQEREANCSENVWEKHVSHGSNIRFSAERDLSRILSVYDNVQMTYTIGFARELHRIVPNLKLLTVRRDWDTTTSDGGMFTGLSRVVEADIPAADYQIIPVTEFHGNIINIAMNSAEIANELHPVVTQTKLKKNKKDPAGFVIVGITREVLVRMAIQEITKFRYGDVRHQTLDTSDAALSWSRYLAAEPISEAHQIQKQVQLPPYLLAVSRRKRGFAVHMHFAVDVFIAHDMDINRGHSVNWLKKSSPLTKSTFVKKHFALMSRRGNRGERIRRLLVRKLDVTYDWDTGELVDLEVQVVTNAIGPANN